MEVLPIAPLKVPSPILLVDAEPIYPSKVLLILPMLLDIFSSCVLRSAASDSRDDCKLPVVDVVSSLVANGACFVN